jgi:hypothetical protein
VKVPGDVSPKVPRLCCVVSSGVNIAANNGVASCVVRAVGMGVTSSRRLGLVVQTVEISTIFVGDKSCSAMFDFGQDSVFRTPPLKESQPLS